MTASFSLARALPRRSVEATDDMTQTVGEFIASRGFMNGADGECSVISALGPHESLGVRATRASRVIPKFSLPESLHFRQPVQIGTVGPLGPASRTTGRHLRGEWWRERPIARYCGQWRRKAGLYRHRLGDLGVIHLRRSAASGSAQAFSSPKAASLARTAPSARYPGRERDSCVCAIR